MCIRDRHHLLHQAVLRIPVQLRIVLVLHDMEEMTTEQVAQILDLQPGTVRVRLHRARLSVRKEMNRIVERAPAPSDCGKPLRMRSKRIAPESGRRPAECRELFLNLSEYLDCLLYTSRCV